MLTEICKQIDFLLTTKQNNSIAQIRNSTELFHWFSNGFLKSQLRVRPDAYGSHVERVIDTEENTAVRETLFEQHNLSTLVSSQSAFQKS